jgi:hypothetical protein
MKTILILLIFQFNHETYDNWQNYLKQTAFRCHFKQTIETLKREEGFSPVRYMDGKYPCIGFGQRTKFYPEQIPNTITITQADIILKNSFWNHIKLVKRVFPLLKGKRLLDAAKMSYQKGIKKVKI